MKNTAMSALLVASSAFAGTPQYTVVDLDTLGGFLSSGLALSEGGSAAGVSEIGDSHFHAFVSDGGEPVDLGTLPGRLESFALTFIGEHPVAISYTLGMTMTSSYMVPSWGGPPQLIGHFLARGANSAGAVVGNVNTTLPEGWLATHACLHAGATLTDLGTLGGANSRALDINDSGFVVGSSELSTGFATHAASWVNGFPHDLGTLGGANSQASAINNSGEAAGYADNVSGEPRACVFTLGTDGSLLDIVDLGVLAGARSSYANDINAQGDVVGVSNARAFLVSGGTMQDLNGLIASDAGWTLQRAYAINDDGLIAGFGDYMGRPHGFLLVPGACAGDLSGDGVVSSADLAILLSSWGQPGTGDLDGNGHTGAEDLAILLAAWGECP